MIKLKNVVRPVIETNTETLKWLPKLPIEWHQEIIEARARRNHGFGSRPIVKTFVSPANFIHFGFSWSKTPSGHSIWGERELSLRERGGD